MSLHCIHNRESGEFLGVQRGETKEEAIEAAARDAGYESLEEACDVTGQTIEEAMEELLVEEIPQFQVIESNAGTLYLAIFEDTQGDRPCTHLLSWDDPRGALRETLDALLAGTATPDAWEGLHEHPRSEYESMVLGGHGYKIVADGWGVHPDQMGRAAKAELGDMESWGAVA